MRHRIDIGSGSSNLIPDADVYWMKQGQRWLRRRRVAVLIVGLMSVLTMPMPAQAGLGDLLDGLLAPVNEVPIVGDIVEPVVQGVVDPLVGQVLDPIAGAVVDPIVDQVVAPVVDPVVNPLVDAVVGDAAPPVVEEGTPPVQETIPNLPSPVEETISNVPPNPPTRESTGVESRPAGVSMSLEVTPPWYSAPVATASVGSSRTTRTQSLEAAVSVQAALIASAPLIWHADGTREVSDRVVGDNWLDGLTGWLRDSADGLGTLLALPVRLLALLARALLTAGSGMIAPLSMLLALTAYLVKDRRWTRTSLTAAR